MTGVSVTVPADLPFRVSAPPSVMSTVTATPVDAAAPSTSATLLVAAGLLRASPAVFTVMLQGLMVTVLPRASGELTGNVDAVTVKMHEPNVVVPVATWRRRTRSRNRGWSTCW